MGGVNFLSHTNDGFKATCIMEINKINKIGNYSPSGHNASSIVDTEGIAPAVMENHGTVTAVVESQDTTTTICLNSGDGGLEPKVMEEWKTIIGNKQMNYRIRKLTPRECFRLMDVSEPDIDKLLNAGISNSQLYKLAGNSIVVSCLYHIFRKMFIEPQNENQQLTLF